MSKQAALTAPGPTRPPLASVEQEQLRAHYAQVPGMVIAPTLGGLFTAWVLWGAVDNRVLVVGMAAVSLLSLSRLVIYRRFLAASPEQAALPKWRWLAVAAAGLSGCLWGSAAPLLYPSLQQSHEVYLLVLLTLLPIVPLAALAEYMPAFYAYFLPCMAPFVVTLALQPSWPEKMAALLLMMMTAAMLTFARRYSRSLADAIALRVALAQQSDALALAVLQKNQLITAASHDLRQPVHAMSMFLAARPQASTSDEDGFMGFLASSLRNLGELLNNLLDVGQLEAGVLRARPQAMSLAPLLHKLAHEYGALARANGLAWRCKVLDLVVVCDPMLLERILRNLLANALKYTATGHVALLARRQADHVQLLVRDTGIGIAAAQAESVFDEFSRLDDARRVDASGLGLGLAISRRLALLLGTPIRLRSVPGRGSMFSLNLPLALPGLRPAAWPAASSTQPLPALAPRQVAVIDDNAAGAAGVVALLRYGGHRAQAYTSLDDASAALSRSENRPDLLIVDLALGHGVSGFDAVSRLRQELGWAVPALLVTGNTDPVWLRRAFEAGLVLLHKPVDPALLWACLAEPVAAVDVGTAGSGQAPARGRISTPTVPVCGP